MPKNIVLIPLNQSQLSLEIFPYVEKYISSDYNKLVLYYITKPPKGAGFGAIQSDSGRILKPGIELKGPATHPIFASQQEESIIAHVKAEMISTTNRLEQLGYDVEILVDFSKNAVDEILNVIDKKGISLVAMSTRAHVGVTRFFFQDIAYTLSGKIKIPMLIIHPSDQ